MVVSVSTIPIDSATKFKKSPFVQASTLPRFVIVWPWFIVRIKCIFVVVGTSVWTAVIDTEFLFVLSGLLQIDVFVMTFNAVLNILNVVLVLTKIKHKM